MRQLIIICIAAVVSIGPVAEGEVLCEPLVVPGCVLITRASSTSPEFRVYDPAGGNCYYRGSVSLEYMGGEDGAPPAGIEVGPNGNIFVWEQSQGPLHEHDGVTGEYLGQATVGDTGLQGRGFCFLPDGDILVSGGASSKVARFDGDTGAYLGDFVPQGSGGLSTCFGVTLGPNGNLFACSVKSNQVLQYDGNTGAFLGVYASVLTPYDLAFDSNGSLFVSTRENGTVVQISPDGTNLGQFNQVNIPPARGIDIGLDGDVYVASWDDYGGFQEGAYRFDRNTGSLIGSLPTPNAIFCSVYRPESGSGCALGEIEDCFGNCCPADWIGDGYCDDGGYSWNGIPIYLNCGPFDCDGGDCQPESCSWLIQDCFGNWFPASWIGDGYCDNGIYSWNGIPIYLTCEEFDCDGGDCPPETCGISPTGACCTDSSCNITSQPDCTGDWFGSGTSCDDGNVDCAATGTYFVPGDYSSIQAAVNAVGEYSIINVGPGTYYEHVNLNGKNLQIIGVGGPEMTTIHGMNSNTVISMVSGEDATTTIDGFSITAGFNSSGAGIRCDGNPFILNCKIYGNNANSIIGGLLSIGGEGPTIGNTHFCENDVNGFPDSHIWGEWTELDFVTFADDCSTPLPEQGACCMGGTDCDVLAPTDCGDMGGDYQGDYVPCDAYACAIPGACCTDDECQVEYEVDCDGEYLGDGAGCNDNPCYTPAPGACCIDEQCSLVLEANCDGDFLGDDTTCDDNPCYVPPTGACCLGETCIGDRTEAQCDTVGGSWNEGQVCDESTCIETPCDGDFNDDDTVSVDDLLSVIQGWGDPYGVDDLLLVIANWGQSCP